MPLQIQLEMLSPLDSLRETVTEEFRFESVETYVPTKLQAASAAACASRAGRMTSVT